MAQKPTKVRGVYASGVSNPFRADSDGGLAMTEGERYVEELVFAAMQPDDSENPFQDLGPTDHPIFKLSADPAWKVVARRRIKRMFDILERFNLARFVRADFGRGDGQGSLTCEVVYLNLETLRERRFAAAYTPDGDVDLRSI